MRLANTLTLRPGQRSGKGKRAKATSVDVAERLEWIILKISMYPKMKDSELKRMFIERYNVNWQVTNMYIARARVLARSRSNLKKSQAVDIVQNTLMDIIQNAEPSARLGACYQMARIFGIQAPERTEITGKDGRPLESQRVTFILPAKEKIRELKEARDVELSVNGNGNSHE